MENTLLADEWVREHFYVIPKSRKEWPPYAGYGVVTLVSKDVPLVGAYSLDFSETTMSRNALIVDVQLRDHESSAAQTVRLANVHLESLGSGAKARQSQLEATSKELTQEGIFAGIVAGDMNAFGPTDKGLPESFGLTDAWDLDDEDGLTWGHQPKCQFPPDRYCTPSKSRLLLILSSSPQARQDMLCYQRNRHFVDTSEYDFTHRTALNLWCGSQDAG